MQRRPKNSMLELQNIKSNENYIQADYVPEGSNEKGFVKVDTASGDIVESTTTTYDGRLNGYLFHAKKALIRLAESKNGLPEKYMVMWY